MFYCDHCAEQNHYPVWNRDDMKSVGPCEICKQIVPCNDVHHDMLSLGSVELHIIEKTSFFNPEKPIFYAPVDMFRIIGFDLKQVRENEDYVLVPVSYKEDFKDIVEARKQVKELRGKVRADSSQKYFLFNSEGYMERIEV